MKVEDFSQQSAPELEKIMIEKKEHLRSLCFDLASGKVKNVMEIRKIKKDIARIMTYLNQKSDKKETVQK